jgi:hypothetical protein
MNTQVEIEVPAATAWPIVMAFGFTLVFAGFVTAAAVSLLGGVLVMVGTAGWFRQVLPVESHECVPVDREEIAIERSAEAVERIAVSQTVPRAWLPLEIHPISAGVKGGLAGGGAMALLAGLYGIVSGNGIWYAMSLLVAGLLPGVGAQPAMQMGAFNTQVFLVAVPLHLLMSLLVGLLYGAMLPMLPRHPIVLGGVIAPLLWSVLIYGILDFVNPVMNQHIDWRWFVASQVAFGVVAGLVVAVQERIPTRQRAPWADRMGIDAPGLMKEHGEEREQ